mmetsp:Transcript_581/g.1932  ORF Transcript_581/g.1932 Transcript_581/m.1932 type:complete len:252 (-) Transcript_581:289-1044(-)
MPHIPFRSDKSAASTSFLWRVLRTGSTRYHICGRRLPRAARCTYSSPSRSSTLIASMASLFAVAVMRRTVTSAASQGPGTRDETCGRGPGRSAPRRRKDECSGPAAPAPLASPLSLPRSTPLRRQTPALRARSRRRRGRAHREQSRHRHRATTLQRSPSAAQRREMARVREARARGSAPQAAEGLRSPPWRRTACRRLSPALAPRRPLEQAATAAPRAASLRFAGARAAAARASPSLASRARRVERGGRLP